MKDDSTKFLFTLLFLAAVFFIASFAAVNEAKEVQPDDSAVPAIEPYRAVFFDIAPEISASSVVISRLKTGQELFAKNLDALMPVASITKLLTAVIFLEYADLFDLVTITHDAKNPQDTGEKMSALSAGERAKGEDVLKMMMIGSYNDSARSAAEFVSKKTNPLHDSSTFPDRMKFFSDLMNEKAAEIGMASSHFDNPAGLDSIDNYSTARDLLSLVSYITEHQPRIWDVSRIYETDIFSFSGAKLHLVNTNPLLRGIFNILGTKTGSTDLAKESLVLVVNIKANDPIAFVVLRSDDRWKDAQTLIEWVKLVYNLSG
ncbi:MAG: hypothetical protein A2934_01210 [Candidatus Sungbacteria bacterium RIFCSPLOWO2_01_FULL_47_10]|uniref:Peptidase S11 D-alanyl-D-alanine carboxypeptidase A N-terminal domain-containing protein n=1 Tax=Candidatus Sungbacteria bacterium RIFCSPLOWO2_01_FULL_47_10 TaxID=1802276 RepID=A0A1G2L124_9BACT|nr:MAG: hypothetical protein A2934_01210 [Candidatus Sungbacteria bacterium RIFCSPLOWO2_01_FULL_47_10]